MSDTLTERLRKRLGDSREPTTEAGKRLLAWLDKVERENTDSQSWRNGVSYARECTGRSLPGIEAEAAAPALDRAEKAEAALETMRTYARHAPLCSYSPTYPDAPEATCDCGFDAALAEYAALTAPSGDEEARRG